MMKKKLSHFKGEISVIVYWQRRFYLPGKPCKSNDSDIFEYLLNIYLTMSNISLTMLNTYPKMFNIYLKEGIHVTNYIRRKNLSYMYRCHKVGFV